LCWLAISSSLLFLLDLAEQASVLDCDGGLRCEGLQQLRHVGGKGAFDLPGDRQRTEHAPLAQQRNGEQRSHARPYDDLLQGFAELICTADVGDFERCTRFHGAAGCPFTNAQGLCEHGFDQFGREPIRGAQL